MMSSVVLLTVFASKMRQVSKLFNNITRVSNDPIEIVSVAAQSPESSAIDKYNENSNDNFQDPNTNTNTNTNFNDTKQFNKKQLQLIKTVAKISTLVGCTLFTTMVSMTVMAIAVITNDTAPTMGALAASIDICVNSVCLLLQWPFAENWYNRRCNPCNNVMIRMCANNVEQYIRQTAIATD